MSRTPALTTLALLALTAPLLPAGPGHATTEGSAGRLAFVLGPVNNEEIVLVGTDGTGTTQLTDTTGRDIDPAWSPDGSKIAWSSTRPDAGGSEGHLNIWVMNADGSSMMNLTDGPDTTGFANTGVEPTWSPDGQWIAYNYAGEVWKRPAAGGPAVELMLAPGENGTHPSWSPDGRIAFVRGGEIWVMNGDGSNQTQLTSTAHPAAEKYPDWSPDGKRIVYERQGQIWRMNADGTGQVPVAAGTGKCGTRPEWSPEGDRIVFSSSCFTAPNGPDIFTARPDGTKVVRHGTSTSAAESSPAWQPLADDAVRGTYTTTGTQLTKRKVKVAGEVFPASTGDAVQVTLQRKTKNGYKKVAGEVLTLGEYGGYGTGLARPDAKKCRVVAKFLGDEDSKPSKDVVTFAC